MRLDPPLLVQLETETCCVCAISFAMTVDFTAARRRDLKSFHCPAGHSQSYTKSEADGLRERLKRAEENIAATEGMLSVARRERDHQERRVRSLRGVIGRMKKVRR